MSLQQSIQASYDGFVQLAQRHGLCVRTHREWRTVKPERGQINGLPNTYGTLVATDGVACYIQLGSGQLFHAHIAHWQKERTQRAAGTLDRRSRRAGPPANDQDEKRTALLALLEDL